MTLRDKAPKRQGRPGRIDEGTAQRIVDAVGLPLCDGVDMKALAAALNHVTTETAIRAHKLPPKAKIKSLSQFRKTFEGMLEQIGRTLPRQELRPPTPDAAWVEDVTAWLSDAERALSADPSNRGGRPPALPAHFFDLILGLYDAAFGRKPAYSYAEADKKLGPTGRFVSASIMAAIESAEDLQVYDRFLRQRGSKDDWSLIGDDALQKALKSAVRKPRRTRGPDDKSEEGHEYEWQVYSDFFRTVFLRKPA